MVLVVVVDDAHASVGSLEAFDFSGLCRWTLCEYSTIPLYTSCAGGCLFAVGIDCEALMVTLVVVQ